MTIPRPLPLQNMMVLQKGLNKLRMNEACNYCFVIKTITTVSSFHESLVGETLCEAYSDDMLDEPFHYVYSVRRPCYSDNPNAEKVAVVILISSRCQIG